MARWIGAQGQVKMVKKTQKHPYLCCLTQRTPNPKRKIFFQSALEDLLIP